MKANSKKIKIIISVCACAIFFVVPESQAKSKKKTNSELSSLKYKAGEENEVKALKAEMFIAAQEEKAIAQIHKLLRKYSGTALEPDLQLRLAELFVRRAKTDRFLEVHRTSEEIVSIVPKAVASAASKKQIQKAIDIYDRIEKRFPRFEKIDVVVFNNAFANQQVGNEKKAEREYARLINEFPSSMLMPDALLAMGELQFSKHDFKRALTSFQAIRQYPDSQVYPYGIYKAAWTQYNLREVAAGMKDLEDVIRYGKYVKEQGIDARLDLRKEALLDMALFYEDILPAKDAFTYFEKQAAELDSSPVLLRLTELYKRHGRYQDIKVILTDLIRRTPNSNYVPIAYVELMDASEKLKKRQDIVTLLGSFNSVCEENSKWAKAQSPDLSTDREGPYLAFNEEMDKKITPSQICRRVFDKMALGYANKWLKLWHKDEKQTDLADVTEQAFSIYLKSDDKSQESSRARFVYAELLFKRGKMREASEQYAITGRLTQDKSIGHDARYYAIFSLEKAVGDKWDTNDEKKFRTLANEYLTKNPDGKFVLDVEFKGAFISYEKARYAEAEPIFKRLGTRYAKLEKGIKSQDLYLDILNIKKDYSTLRDYALTLKTGAKGERYDKLNKIYEEAYFLIVQKHEEKGDYKLAINEYNDFAKLNPNSGLAQKALWNSTQLQFKTGNLVAAAESAVKYYDKYKDTKEGKDALIKAAQTYESMGQLGRAANVVIKLSLAEENQKQKWTLMAADFYMLDGDLTNASKYYETLRKSGSSEVAFHALEQLKNIAEKQNNEKVKLNLMSLIANSEHQPQASLAAVYFAEEKLKEKKYEDAFNMSKKIISQEKSGASKNALARARLIQARVLAKEFINQSVKSKLERVQTVLTLKTEKLSKAQIAFQSAANYGDASVAMNAYNELADCYLAYSDSLRTMPPPTGLPESENQAFQAEMEKLAIPMEEKGVEAKVNAYTIAQKLGSKNLLSSIESDLKKMNQPVTKAASSVVAEPAPIVLPIYAGVGS